MMTKQDFIAIADALARTRPPQFDTEPGRGTVTTSYWAQWRVTRDAIIGVLQHSNPRFDRIRFIRATEA